MAWTDLSFPFGSTLTSAQMTNLFNNFQGLAAQDAGSPILPVRQIKSVQISDATLGISYAIYGRINMDVSSGSAVYLFANVEDGLGASGSAGLTVVNHRLGEATAGTLITASTSVRWDSAAAVSLVPVSVTAVHSASASQVYSYYFQAQEADVTAVANNSIDGLKFIAVEMGYPDGL